MLRAERGAALIVVLLFMVLMFILISSMLFVGGNESVLAGLQRDGVRAFEHATAGLEEGVDRVEGGLPYLQPFTGSLDPAIAVTVVTLRRGPSAAWLEIQSNATVIRARRKLSLLSLAVSRMIPPNIVFCSNFAEQGNAASIGSGDVYCETFIRYASAPSAGSVTYAGWRISKGAPQALPACYTHLGCVTAANTDPNPNDRCTGASPDTRCKWFPGERLTVYATDPTATDILANTNQATCTFSGGTFTGIKAEDATGTSNTYPLYGFDTDSVVVSTSGVVTPVVPPQAMTGSRPCGLPYKYVWRTFPDESGTPTTRYFKTTIFEEWFDNYWRLDQNSLSYVKRNGSACSTQPCLPNGLEPNLASYPDFGAVPPFLPFNQIDNNYNEYRTGGGTINDSSGIDLGYCANPNTCDSPASRPTIVLLDNGDYIINGNLTGYGLLLIDGNLTINGNLTYWGTLVVNGNLTLGSGNVTIYGGVLAKSTAYLTGNITINAGGSVSNVLIGPATVTRKSWWER